MILRFPLSLIFLSLHLERKCSLPVLLTGFGRERPSLISPVKDFWFLSGLSSGCIFPTLPFFSWVGEVLGWFSFSLNPTILGLILSASHLVSQGRVLKCSSLCTFFSSCRVEITTDICMMSVSFYMCPLQRLVFSISGRLHVLSLQVCMLSVEACINL